MYIAAARVHADVALHAEITRAALLGLAHLGVALFIFILGQTRHLNEFGIHNAAVAHDIAALLKCAGKRLKKYLAGSVLFQHVPKLEQRCGVRNPLVDKSRFS